MTTEDIDKAPIGISSTYNYGNPNNMHLSQFSYKVKEGVNQSGLISTLCNTVGVSDGISMGTERMRYLLQSRLRKSWTDMIPKAIGFASTSFTSL